MATAAPINPRRYTLSEVAEDVVALLEALGIARAHVLGSSSGGSVAQQLAVMRPDLLASLVLLGTPLSLRTRPLIADDVDALSDPIPEDRIRDSLSANACCTQRMQAI
ncbi:pimeloyl-ACP methyl ester carboxylesterase [Paenarthrobacter nicotinovorans]|uniref:Pimeloyl-ACP methyl ester carboxylesterase n=1 Tax=Paenarthrobacter nicotinovorans TaxID=29320 RepID=A0ABT9TJ68_PAENI|nr:alpha/beta fold hydrolase [Paenarthrobacter nicotinovorans]MDQ0100637.1 pimeloyl-ACP methyl ester carboxylesterase [Paenarthrobacter nicotinovorans]